MQSMLPSQKSSSLLNTHRCLPLPPRGARPLPARLPRDASAAAAAAAAAAAISATM